MSNYELEREISLARAAAEMLDMSDESKLDMIYQIGGIHDISTSYLPNHTNGETRAITKLLKEHGAKISPVRANKVLVKLGLLEVKERLSTMYADQIKRFNSLTTRGLKFGINSQLPRVPGQTQPRFYCSKFKELLAIIINNDTK